MEEGTSAGLGGLAAGAGRDFTAPREIAQHIPRRDRIGVKRPRQGSSGARLGRILAGQRFRTRYSERAVVPQQLVELPHQALRIVGVDGALVRQQQCSFRMTLRKERTAWCGTLTKASSGSTLLTLGHSLRNGNRSRRRDSLRGPNFDRTR